MLIKRPVKVKMIMTPKTRDDFEKNYLGELHQIRLELEQLEFQNKKLLAEAKKKNIDSQEMAIKIEQERKKRLLRLEQLEIRIKEILKIEDGVELNHSNIDSYVDVQVGDHWERVVESTEIVLKDGIIVEIREKHTGNML